MEPGFVNLLYRTTVYLGNRGAIAARDFPVEKAFQYIDDLLDIDTSVGLHIKDDSELNALLGLYQRHLAKFWGAPTANRRDGQNVPVLADKRNAAKKLDVLLLHRDYLVDNLRNRGFIKRTIDAAELLDARGYYPCIDYHLDQATVRAKAWCAYPRVGSSPDLTASEG